MSLAFYLIYLAICVSIFISLAIGGFSGGSGKEPTCNAEDTGDGGPIPGLGRYPGEGNNNLFQYSCLGNPMDSESLWAIVQRVTKSQT